MGSLGWRCHTLPRKQFVLMIHVPHGVLRRIHPDLQVRIIFHQFEHGARHTQDASANCGAAGIDISFSLKQFREPMCHTGGNLANLLVPVTGQVTPSQLRISNNLAYLPQHFMACWCQLSETVCPAHHDVRDIIPHPFVDVA